MMIVFNRLSTVKIVLSSGNEPSVRVINHSKDPHVVRPLSLAASMSLQLKVTAGALTSYVAAGLANVTALLIVSVSATHYIQV